MTNRQTTTTLDNTTLHACVWSNRTTAKASILWGVVKSMSCMAPHVKFITKIKKVTQPGDITRFDFFIQVGHGDQVLKALGEMCQALRGEKETKLGKMTVKRHIPFFGRKQTPQHTRVSAHIGELRRRASMPKGNCVQICSLNINNATNKLEELSEYAKNNQLGILGIQETRITNLASPIRLSGYKVHSTPSKRGEPGSVGVALCVAKHLPQVAFGKNASKYVTAAQVWLGQNIYYIVNVYVPCQARPRGLALKDIANLLLEIEKKRTPYSRILMFGDFNMSSEELDQLLEGWYKDGFLVRLSHNRNSSTYHAKVKWSTLDHFVGMSQSGESEIGTPWVDRKCDISDHWPIRVTISTGEVQDGIIPYRARPQPQFMTRTICETDVNRFQDSNRFSQLEDEWGKVEEEWEDGFPFLDMNGIISFTEAIKGAAMDLGAYKSPSVKKDAPLGLPVKCRRLIKKRTAAFRTWVELKASKDDREETARNQYRKIAKTARKAVKEAKIRLRIDRISKMVHKYRGGSKVSRRFWQDLKKLNGANQMDEAGRLLGPVRDREGNIKFGGEATAVWVNHTRELFSDEEGLSKNPAHWKDAYNSLPVNTPIADLNEEIEWVELNSILASLPRNKAPGPDRVPYEVFKVAHVPPNPDDPDWNTKPRSKFGRLLLRVCQYMFRDGLDPEANKTVLKYIYKKHSAMETANFRGIALINTLVKLVTMVVEVRIRKGLEAANFFISEQAGFRALEECPAQVTALYEIVCRRSIDSKTTYVAFIDFYKAYDMVPHEAVIEKLRRAGVHGKCLRFIESLYSDGSIRLNVDGQLGDDVVNVMRGLRQGCIGSPLFFDVFINDILDFRGSEGRSIRELGVTLKAPRFQDGMEKFSGLLLADDVALLASSRVKLDLCLKTLGEWADLNGMRVGVPKCGIMGFGPQGMCKVQQWAHRWTCKGGGIIQQEDLIPVVQEYLYLGCAISPETNKGIDLDHMAKRRSEMARGSLHKITPTLRDILVPIEVKVKLIKSVLCPSILYGSEVWGMCRARSDHGQRVLMKAIGYSLDATRVPDVVLAELEIPSIYASSNSARARALYKWAGVKTTVKKLIRAPSNKGRRLTWVSGTNRYINAFYKKVALRAERDIGWNLQNYGSTNGYLNFAAGAKEEVKKVCGEKEFKDGNSTSYTGYKEASFLATKNFVRQGIAFPSISKGISLLVGFRCNLVKLGRRQAFLQVLPNRFLSECMCCGEHVDGGENRRHLLFFCSAWSVQRQLYVDPIIHQICRRYFNCRPPFALNQEERRSLMTLLLGGAVPGTGGKAYLKDWIAKITTAQGKKSGVCDRTGLPTVLNESDLLRPRNGVPVPRFCLVALFLQKVFYLRSRIEKTLLRSLRAEAPGGMVVVENPNQPHAVVGRSPDTSPPDPG